MMVEVIGDHRRLPDGPHVVTIGNFDGVHRGHQYLLEQVVERAHHRNARSVAITFDPLPVEVLRPERAPKRLTTTDERVRLIEAIGIDSVLLLRFDQQLSQQTPEEFVMALLDILQPIEFVIGTDFNFGRNRSGTAETLRDLGRRFGFDTTVHERIGDRSGDFSSTRIRMLVEAGSVAEAFPLLGRPFSVRGVVEVGNGRGRQLGFPTANLALAASQLVPGDGIYVSMSVIDGRPPLLPSMTYVGSRPTFDEVRRVVEVNILDFDQDIYGRELSTLFVDKVRGDQRFETIDELIAQMERDRARTREIVAALPDGWPGAPVLEALGIGEGARLGER